MQQTIVRNLSRLSVSPVVTIICNTFFCRLRGLIFQPPISYEKGLLLVFNKESRLDSSIHMFGVNSDLAVVWINRSGLVVDVRLAKRWRPAYMSNRPACYVLELNPARIKDFSIGDQVDIEAGLLDKQG